MRGRGRPTARAGAAAVMAMVAATLQWAPAAPPVAQAYQRATSASGLTLTYPSGLTVTASVAAGTNGPAPEVTSTATFGTGYDYVAANHTPSPGSATPGFVPRLPDAPQCAFYGTCTDRGTLTFSFSRPVRNPRMHVLEIGGDRFNASTANAISARMTLTTPGVTPSIADGVNLAVTGGSTIEAPSKTMQRTCTGASVAGCGTVLFTGTTSTLSFDLSSAMALRSGTANATLTGADAFPVTFTFAEDFGDAPASYDAGNAARAILSDLQLGSGATIDNGSTANATTSPNAGAGAAGDTDDANPTLAPLTPGDTGPYSVTVPVSGLSADATVCGWIDFNRNGTFQTAAGTEQACTTVAAGATSATLTWTTHTAVSGSGGVTYARFRIGYDATATSSPTGPSDSGEVEDYMVSVASGRPTWDCSVNQSGYLFQQPASTLMVQEIDMVTGGASTAFTMPISVNAVGYNPVDDYIYGYSSTLGAIVRIGSDGTYDNLGLPAGITAGQYFNTGEVDPDGYYWLAQANTTLGGYNWWQIDLTSVPSPTVVKSGFVSNTMGGVTYAQGPDWAYVGGYLWRVMYRTGTPSLLTAPAALVRFDPATGVQTVVANLGDIDGPGTDRNNTYGAVYADADGFLYIANNGVGEIYRVDVLSGASATATFFASGPASSANDGARCVDSLIATDYGDAPNSYRTTLAGGGPRHSLVGFDPLTNTADLMIGSTVDRETDGAPTTNATGDDTTAVDDETAGPFSLAAGGTNARITVPVTNDIGATATLYAWIDANLNGVFTANEFASTTVAPGATSATITWTGLPAALVEGTNPVIRLRLTTDTLTDNAGTTYDDRASGPASDGEVEDHRATVGPPPTLTVRKDVVGRYDTGDQFTLQVAGFPSVTTSGSSTGVQVQQVGPLTVVPGASYSVSEAAAGSTNLANYTSTYECVDELAQVVASGSGRAFGVNGGYAAGSSITCTITNTPVLYPILTVDKSVASGPTALGGGQYEVVYDITVTNTGRGDGVYDLSDTVAVGDGVAVVSTGVTDAQPPVTTGPLPTIVAGRTIAGAPTGGSTVHTYRVSVVVDSPADLPATEADCVDSDGTGSGVANTASLTIDGQTTTDTACAPLPSTTLDKSLDSIVGNGDGTYTFTYVLTVGHNGPATVYDLSDTFRFSDAVEIVDGTVEVVASTPPGAAALTAGFDGDAQPQIAEGVVIAGGETHTYVVTVDVTVDFPSVTPENSDCTLGGDAGTGALNQAALVANDDTLTAEDCKPFPGLSVIKSVSSGPSALGAGQFEVVYAITVTNSGTAPGTYDLDDTVALGAGVTLVSAEVTGTDPVLVTNDDFDGAADPNIVTGQPIDAASGGVAATHTYEVTVVVETPGPLDPVEADCTDTDGTGSGVTNTATLTDEVGPQDATACAPLPSFAVAKSVDASQLDATGVVTYTLTVTNTGSVAYTGGSSVATFSDDLSDVLDNATYVAASATSDVAGWTFAGPTAGILSGEGPLAVGQTASITYQVQVGPQAGGSDYLLHNAVQTGPGGSCTGTCATDTPLPGLDVVKTATVATPPLVEGGSVTYEVTFTNIGGTVQTLSYLDDLSGVADDATVTVAPIVLAPGYGVTAAHSGDLITIQGGSIPPGQTVTVTYTVTVNDPDTGDHLLTNYVLEPGETPPAACLPGDTRCTSTPVQSYTVAKTAGELQTDGTVTYTLTIVNTGQTDFTAAGFSDDLSGVLDNATYLPASEASTVAGWTPFTLTGTTLTGAGPLAVGQAATITYAVQVNEPHTGTDYVLRNTVTPTTPGGGCVGTCTTDTPLPALEITKTADPASGSAVVEGESIDYRIQFDNTGATDQVLAFDDVLTAIDDDAEIGTIEVIQTTGSSVTATRVGDRIEIRGTLLAGGAAAVVYTATVDAPDTGDHMLGNAVVPAGELPPVDCLPGDPLCTVNPVRSFGIAKSASALQPDGTVTYTLTVTNTGAVAYTALEPAGFGDDLSGVLDDATFVTGSVSSTVAGWNFAEPMAPGTTLTGAGPLAVGETATITYVVTVDEPAAGDHVLGNVVVPAGPGGSCAGACTTSTPVPGLDVAKSSAVVAAPLVPGGRVDYEITFVNTGQTVQTLAFDDVLTAVLDDATIGTIAVDQPGGSTVTAILNGDRIEVRGDLPIGATAVVRYTATVDDPDTGDHVLGNVVVPAGELPPADCLPDDALCTVNPVQSFSIAKSASALQPDGTVTYTLTIVNTGAVAYSDLEPASFSDELAGVLDNATFVTSSASSTLAGWTFTEPAAPATTLTGAGPLPIGATATITYTVQVSEPHTGDDYVLRNVVAPTSPGGACAVTCTTDTPLPGLAVTKTADPPSGTAVRAGDTVTYTLTFANLGDAAAPVDFTDHLGGILDDAEVTTGPAIDPGSDPGLVISPPYTPGDTAFTIIGVLNIGDQATVSYTVTVDDPVTGDLVLGNFVVEGAATPPTACLPGDPLCTVNPVAGISIVKSSPTTSVTGVGQVIPYEFLVTNTGGVTLTGVTVTDTVAPPSDPANLSPIVCGPLQDLPNGTVTLAPGEAVTCYASYTVTTADYNSATVEDAATATGTPPSGESPVSPPSPLVIPVEPNPSITIDKTATPDDLALFVLNQVVTYSFLVTNTGNVTLTGVHVVEGTFTGTGTLSPVDCPTTTLAAGESMTCTATYTITQLDVDAGHITNEATAAGTPPTGPEVPSPPDEVTIPSPPEPALTIDKSSPTTLITTIGQSVPYQFVVRNTGNVTLTGIVVNDPKIGAVSCPQTTLAPNATTTCTGVYTVTAADLDAGALRNTATATGTPPGGPAVTSPPDEVTIPARQSPALHVAKATTTVEVTTIGQIVPFTFLVTNAGNVTMHGVTVNDPKIPDVTCPRSTLAAGESMTCTGDYAVVPADIDAGRVVNIASVGGTPPGGTPITPVVSNEVMVPVPPSAPTPTPPTTPPPAPIPDPDLPATGGNSRTLLAVAVVIGGFGVLLTRATRRRTRRTHATH